jgi:hypothetical protein
MTSSRRRLGLLLPAFLLAVLSAGLASAASGGWTIARSPSSVNKGVATNISFTATNVAGGSSLGCVRLEPPRAFTVNSVVVDSVSGSLNWTADAPTAGSGYTLVQIHASTKADVIKVDGDVVRFHVRVIGTTAGSYTWPAESRDDEKCKSGIDTDSVTVAILGTSPTPTPTPQPTPKPTPKPTPRPTPAPTGTPTPTTRATASPTATPTPTRTARSTPSANPTTAPASTPSASAPAGYPPSGGGSAGSGGTGLPRGGDGETDPFRVGTGDERSRQIDTQVAASGLMRLDGLLVWAVPSLVFTVPGLLLLLAILAQIAGAAAWLPFARRKLGAFGIRRS